MKCSFLDYVKNSDDWPSNPSNEIQLKCDKRPPKPSKNEILIFILHSASDDCLSNQIPPPPAEKFDIFKSTFWLDQSMPPPLKILAEYQLFCTKPSEQAHFLIWLKWVQGVVCYDWNLQNVISQQNINGYAWNLQNRAHFSESIEMSPRSGMLRSKLTKA